MLAMVWLLLEEILSSYFDPILGIYAALAGAFTTAIVPYVIRRIAPTKTSLQCFSLIFLTRVAVAVVPSFILPTPLLLVTVYSVVIVSSAIYIAERGFSIRSLGFKFSKSKAQILCGLILGLLMGMTEYVILASDMERYLLFPAFSVANLFYVALIMFAFVALGEEILFRSLAQTSFEEELGDPRAATLFVSLAFTIMHFGYVTDPTKILEIIYVFAAATAIGYAFTKTRSLVLPILAHGVANTLLFGILPYLM